MLLDGGLGFCLLVILVVDVGLLTGCSEQFCSVFFLDSENWSCATFSISSLPIINIAHFPDHVNNKFQIFYDRSKSIRQNDRIV